MNEKEWRARYLSLAKEKLPEEARLRIHRTLQAAAKSPHMARSGLRRSAWWIGAGAVAAGLLTLALLSHAPQTTKPANHPHHPTPPVVVIAKASLQNLDMVNPAVGWGITKTGRVLRTTDGGKTWLDVTPKGEPKSAPGYGGPAIGTTDGSHAWLAVSQLSSISQQLPVVIVYRTSDGGLSWQHVTLQQNGTPQIQFLPSGTGFLLLHQGAAAGSEGVLLLRSADAGASWQVISQGTPQSNARIFGGDKSGFGFLDAQHGWITGEWAADSILLYETQDGGKTWQVPTLPVPSGLSAQGGSATSMPPYFFGGSDGVMPVAFGMPGQPTDFYQTSDGGRTWTPTVPVNGGGNRLVYSVVSQSVIVASDGTKLFRTADGGGNWTSVQPNLSLQGVSELDFVSGMDGWAVVQGGLLHTADGGATWTKAGAK